MQIFAAPTNSMVLVYYCWCSNKEYWMSTLTYCRLVLLANVFIVTERKVLDYYCCLRVQRTQQNLNNSQTFPFALITLMLSLNAFWVFHIFTDWWFLQEKTNNFTVLRFKFKILSIFFIPTNTANFTLTPSTYRPVQLLIMNLQLSHWYICRHWTELQAIHLIAAIPCTKMHTHTHFSSLFFCSSCITHQPPTSFSPTGSNIILSSFRFTSLARVSQYDRSFTEHVNSWWLCVTTDAICHVFYIHPHQWRSRVEPLMSLVQWLVLHLDFILFSVAWPKFPFIHLLNCLSTQCWKLVQLS